MSAATVAVYAGSFDPVTNGHLDVLARACRLFDRVVVGIGIHPTRKPLFSTEERLALLRETAAPLGPVEVDAFEGLLIHYCQRVGARVLIRGLRHAMDFEYELQIAQANADMVPEIETLFLPTAPVWGHITASLVREIASHGGDVSRYAPEPVCRALREKFAGRSVAGAVVDGVASASPSG
ncbi:MAG: pantetheine-phosphate adenylyltransferase [Myxococcota bacterium]